MWIFPFYLIFTLIKDWYVYKKQYKRYSKRKINLSNSDESDYDYQDDYVWIDKENKLWFIDYYNNYIYCEKKNICLKDTTKLKGYIE